MTADIRRYRDRAEELRAKADEFTPENRKMLLEIADDYDDFVKRAERVLTEMDLQSTGISNSDARLAASTKESAKGQVRSD